jgi:hypothetical protein
MSVLRIVSPLLLGIGLAAGANGNPGELLPSSGHAAVKSDPARCDTRHLTTNWQVSMDHPGLVDSVRIGNIADSCDGGILYVLTNDDDANPPAVNIPMDESTQVDVALGLPLEAVSTLTIVILAPNTL